MSAFPLLSEYLADASSIWADCGAEFPCGHYAKLDIAAIIAEYGDMPLDELKWRLRCKCGGRGEIRLVTSGRPARTK